MAKKQPSKNSARSKKGTKKSGGALGKWFSAFFLSAIIVMGFAAFALWQTVKTPIKLTEKERVVTVKQGESYYKLLEKWQDKGLIGNASIAKIYTKLFVKAPLQQGAYSLRKGMNLAQVLDSFTGAKQAKMVTVRIIEGKRTKDLFEVLAKTEGIIKEVSTLPEDEVLDTLNIEETHLEGVFAPNTYFFAQNTSDIEILEYLYQQQQKILTTAWENRAENLPYDSPYEALIMASIIEKETGVAAEREMVAGVFVNRLRKGMKLQTDPTVIYGMGDRYDGDIRKKDLREATDYNTYVIKGLPPTPIALPSKAAIEAALNPAQTDALFFVATGTGGHTFTKTYEEHKKAVAEYLKVIRAQK